AFKRQADGLVCQHAPELRILGPARTWRTDFPPVQGDKAVVRSAAQPPLHGDLAFRNGERTVGCRVGRQLMDDQPYAVGRIGPQHYIGALEFDPLLAAASIRAKLS